MLRLARADCFEGGTELSVLELSRLSRDAGLLLQLVRADRFKQGTGSSVLSTDSSRLSREAGLLLRLVQVHPYYQRNHQGSHVQLGSSFDWIGWIELRGQTMNSGCHHSH